jgi:glycosyltransferase involved in cell wall biosynthesis
MNGAADGLRTPGIHLFVPMLHRRDAVGEHTRTLRDLLVDAGVPSVIYTELPDPDTVDETRPYRDYERAAVPGDVLVYQVATRSDMTRWLERRPEPVVLNYHSITPPSFFAPWNNGIARMQEAALRDLADLAPHCVLGIGVSAFDVGELRAAGCPTTLVVPVANVPVPPMAPDAEAAAALARRAADGGPWWLSVGRLAPNKAHQDTIAALFVARATSSPDAHLTIVGGPTEPNYSAALRRYVADLGLSGAVEFTTRLSPGQLAARYGAADVLVMLSEHEGFGVPLIEAMAQGLPVVAYDAGAVAEVMGGAGVLLEQKTPGAVARAVATLLGDSARRDALVAAGRDRVASLGVEHAGSDLVRKLQEVAASALTDAGGVAGTRPLRPGGPSSH